MTTDGFVLVQYRSGSSYPTIIGATVHNDVAVAETEASEKRKDAIADRRQVRIAVARIEVLP
jgi:hypothetical protein